MENSFKKKRQLKISRFMCSSTFQLSDLLFCIDFVKCWLTFRLKYDHTDWCPVLLGLPFLERYLKRYLYPDTWNSVCGNLQGKHYRKINMRNAFLCNSLMMFEEM